MAANHNLGGNYWAYLINKDKSPAPLLEQLCLGLATFIATLEPKNTDQLIPQKLAAFYRAVGGNYDSLFLSTPGNSLSLIYQTFGCYHTLQPTTNPFEKPSVPALLPCGFVRWQTMQLLLCPGDHVGFLQEAVRLYDITNPVSGGAFPKVIPKEAFPDRPDPDIVKWHEDLSQKLEQEYKTRKIQATAYYSPRDRSTGPESGTSERRRSGDVNSDFFLNPPMRPPYTRRPSRPSRSNSQEQQNHHTGRRRSGSLPDVAQPWPPGADARYYWSSEQPPLAPTFSNSSAGKPPTHRRTSNSSSQHRTSNSSSHRPSISTQTTQRPATSGSHRPPVSKHHDPHSNHSSPHHRHRNSNPPRPRSPSTINESSGSDASSEDSAAHNYRRRSSLFPPDAPVHHRRRHSHDATYSNGAPPLPQRHSGYPHPQAAKRGATIHYSHVPGANSISPPPRNSHAVKFKDSIFDDQRDNGGSNSAPDTPGANGRNAQPSFRYFDSKGPNVTMSPMGLSPGGGGNNNNSSGGSGNSGNDNDTKKHRKFGLPIRVSTVTGVGGRKYAAATPATPVGAGTKVAW